ncbi:MAG TPA: PadR family transcriptional regulator [Coleofasciculaceae cyanobacterium]
MSLAHVILGLLQQQARTGYDLKTSCFDQCITHLWQADQAQIYRTLDKLEAQGWISCTVEIQHDRPNRKVYSLTAAGEAELVGWLQCPQPCPTVRDPALAQVYFAGLLPQPDLLNLLQRQLETRQQKLTACEAIEIAPHPSVAREQLMQQLVRDLVIRREQVYLDWLKESIEAIQRL